MHQQGAGTEELAAYLQAHSQYHSQYLGEADKAEVCCGQVAGLIEDIPPTAELMNQLVHDIKDRFQALQAALDRSF
jgi:NAD(P)H-dependent flavin oxidoreductase YrpB (nitropropane dioxygenase family)